MKKVPGREKWTRNRVASSEDDGGPDGVGELWFESREALERAMRSAEMSAAFEDGRSFVDLEKSYAVVVEEKPIIG